MSMKVKEQRGNGKIYSIGGISLIRKGREFPDAKINFRTVRRTWKFGRNAPYACIWDSLNGRKFLLGGLFNNLKI